MTTLLGHLQENLLCILSNDAERALIVRNTVDISLFGGQYKTIALRVYDYLDRYRKPPGDHLPDILSDKLDSDNKREAKLYEDIITSIHELQRGINTEYVMAQLETFIRRQSLRGVAVELARELQRDTEDSLEKADALIKKANTQTLSVFDPGTRLSDKTKALMFLDTSQDALLTGIRELDKRGLGPSRKEMFLFIANAKRGKTWFLIQLAKISLIHRLKVCHLTLEMSEDRCSQRYFQALFAMSKRKEKFITTKFLRDKLRRITGLEEVEFRPKLTLDDPKIRAKLEAKIDKWSPRLLDNIVVKQFPTGDLTVPKLEAYLDNLEITQRFVPDLLIVDYPDLMDIDAANYRLSLDEIYKDLRGIFVKRNMAGVVVSQAHRASSKSKQVGSENVAEAYSKIAHADIIVTYSQTPHEAALGLARLYVAGGRNDQDKFTIVISQQYGTGQFVVDSNMMAGNYWGVIPAGGREDEGEEE